MSHNEDKDAREIIDALEQDAQRHDDLDPGPEYWDTFAARVRTRVAAEPRRRPWLAWLARNPAVGFVSAAVVLVAVMFAFNPGTATDASLAEEEYEVLEDVFAAEFYEDLDELSAEEVEDILAGLDQMRRSS